MWNQPKVLKAVDQLMNAVDQIHAIINNEQLVMESDHESNKKKRTK